jgi:hypothetical protein
MALGIVFVPAEAGHELPYYPSFYPQEIRIETMDAKAAAASLGDNALHAYIGETPFFEGQPPAHVRAVASLGSYLVVTFNPAATLVQDRQNRCALARQILTTLAAGDAAYVFYPYPITPYHWDYLHHFDLVQALTAKYQQRSADGQAAAELPPGIRVRGAIARGHASWQTATDEWDATIEEIDVRDLLASHTVGLNGWLGPPWLKEGWFHAYLLLADTIRDEARRLRIDAMYQRLIRGVYAGLEEKLNLERTFVALLRQGCERVVIGYTVRREFFNAEYSGGIENIAYDAITGLHSPIFLRTVKLKDLPWNGWLRLGVDSKPSAAWNPIGGFTDTVGRLLWYAVGDLALFPAPYSGSWMLDRIADYQSTIKPLGRTEQARVTDRP